MKRTSVKVRVDDRPQLWWQHAGRSVLQERAKLLGGPCTNTILANRRRVRQTYQMYYSRYRSPLYRIMDTICGTPNFARDALQSLENQLSDADIAQFRWWYWAHQGKTKVILMATIESILHPLFTFEPGSLHSLLSK